MTCRNARMVLLTGLALVGATGMAKAEADYHDVVIDSAGEIARNSYGNCIRSQWLTDRDLCPSENLVQRIVRTNELTEEDRTVYFQFNRSTLTPEAKDHLNSLVAVLKSDQRITEARIVGFADRIGSVSYNDRLSQQRAETVRDFLVANGYTNARVTKTNWVGKSEPTTNCSTTETRSVLIRCLHNDRKVEVKLEYSGADRVSDAR